MEEKPEIFEKGDIPYSIWLPVIMVLLYVATGFKVLATYKRRTAIAQELVCVT
jgi:hypothetical protein